MANKDRNKRSARKERAAERFEREQQQAASAAPAANESKITKALGLGKSKEQTKTAAKKKDPNKKPGFFARIKNWFRDVRTELRRVTTPTPTEVRTFSVAVLCLLVVFGVVVWLVDTGLVAVLAAFTSLRG